MTERGTDLVNDRLGSSNVESGHHRLELFPVAHKDATDVGGAVEDGLGNVCESACTGQVHRLYSK